MNILNYLQNRGLKPRKVSSSKGGEYACPCPMCGGEDRFHVWPDEPTNQQVRGRFWCRGCGATGNLISLLIEDEGLTYPQACERLGIELKKRAFSPVNLKQPDASRIPETDFQGRTVELPPAAWVERCAKLVSSARDNLLNSPAPLAWLAERGINREMAEAFSLGWLPGEKGKSDFGGWYVRPRASWGLPRADKPTFSFPRGLVIPRIITRHGAPQVVSLRIRRLESDRRAFAPNIKYFVFPGSAVMPLLWMPPALANGSLKGYGVVTVESDLDGILLAGVIVAAQLPLGVFVCQSDRGKPDAAAHRIIRDALCVLVAHDFDQPDQKGRRPGSAASRWWLETYSRARRWPVPVGKDPGEAFQQGADLARWLNLGLPPVLQQGQKWEQQSRLDPTAGLTGQNQEPAGTPGKNTGQEISEYRGRGLVQNQAHSYPAVPAPLRVPAVVLRMVELMREYGLTVFWHDNGGFGLEHKSREFKLAPAEVQRELSECFFSPESCDFFEAAGLYGRITAARIECYANSLSRNAA